MNPLPAELYDVWYHRDPPTPTFDRSRAWLPYFGILADRIVTSTGAATVLDASGATSFLVEALRDRGITAFGLDLANDARPHARPDMLPYCTISLPEAVPTRRYDVVLCWEVLQHLSALDATAKIDAIVAVTNDVILSVRPDDYRDVTHVNAQQPDHWARLFAERGFWRDLDFDATFIAPWAMRFRRVREPVHRLVTSYERKLWHHQEQVDTLRSLATESRARLLLQEATITNLTSQGAGQEEELRALSLALQRMTEQTAQLVADAQAREHRIREIEQQRDVHVRELAERDQRLSEQAARLDALHTQVARQTDELGRLAADLARAETNADDSRRALEQRELDATRLRDQFAAAQQEARRAAAQAEALEAHFAYLQRSLGWGVMTRLQQMRARVAPPQSSRDRMLDFAVLSADLFRRQGLPAAARQSLALARSQGIRGFASLPERQLALQRDRRSYAQWAAWCEQQRYDPARLAPMLEQLRDQPLISVVIPVYNTPEALLRKAIDSVRSQFYTNWELCICDDRSSEPHIRPLLQEYARKDPRIHALFADENSGIAIASNRALSMATGDYVGLLDHDDELTMDALFQVARALQDNDVDLVYSDEDKLEPNGERSDPFFKPAWSPDFLLSCMYTGHFSVYRRSIVEEIGGFRKGYDGSQDYDLALRFTERTDRIAHLPMILYHWRKTAGSTSADGNAKPYAYQAARRALSDALGRRHLEGTVVDAFPTGYYRVKRAIARPGKVSLIIPTRDRVDLLQQCIDSIVAKTDYADYEIIIVDNGSVEPATRAYLRQSSHTVVEHRGPFNFSRLNNVGVQAATGEYVLLLNNDTEVIAPTWLSAMVEQAQRPEVGAVGAKLLYRDGRLQHAGVVLGIGGIAHHSQLLIDGFHGTGYANFPNVIRDYSAVTGACLLLRRRLYQEVGGLDEAHLPINFNDVDLCLRLRARGYLVIFTPYAVLYHHESASRAPSVPPSEYSFMKSTWKHAIQNDPFYSPHLTVDDVDFSVDGSKPDDLQRGWKQPLAAETVGPLHARQMVTQRFESDVHALCVIAIKFATYARPCQGTVRLRITTGPTFDDCLITDERDASELRDNEFALFAFNPLSSTAGTIFEIQLDFTPLTRTDRLTVWRSARPIAPHGACSSDGMSLGGTLTMQVFGYTQPRRSHVRSPRALSSERDEPAC